MRAFYSGHSLTDGVPEVVEQIAASLDDAVPFEFEFQSLPGSLLRERTKGERAASGWTGYQRGRNRAGTGLDVAAALSRKGAFDALVVTERHDLPYAAHAEDTAACLRDIHDRAVEGNPAVRTLLYQAWIEIDLAAPAQWVNYEKAVAELWACVAQKVNLGLAAAGRADRVGLIPGGTAMVDLVERVLRGEVSALCGTKPADRLRAIFTDDVHLTPTGMYFMGAVHFAALFNRSPVGAKPPPQLSDALAAQLQNLAWAHVSAFYAVGAAAAPPRMDTCRALAHGLCRDFYELHVPSPSLLGRLKRERDVFSCQRVYAGADPRNPFADR